MLNFIALLKKRIMEALCELKEFRLTALETEVLYPFKTATSWSFLYLCGSIIDVWKEHVVSFYFDFKRLELKINS